MSAVACPVTGSIWNSVGPPMVGAVTSAMSSAATSPSVLAVASARSAAAVGLPIVVAAMSGAVSTVVFPKRKSGLVPSTVSSPGAADCPNPSVVSMSATSPTVVPPIVWFPTLLHDGAFGPSCSSSLLVASAANCISPMPTVLDSCPLVIGSPVAFLSNSPGI